jgi:hypothetical protein
MGRRPTKEGIEQHNNAYVEGYEVLGRRGNGSGNGNGNGGAVTASKYRVESFVISLRVRVRFVIVSELERKCRRRGRRGLSRNGGLLYTCVGQGIGVGGKRYIAESHLLAAAAAAASLVWSGLVFSGRCVV